MTAAMGPVITPDGRRLYVCNRFDNDVSVIDVANFEELTRLKNGSRASSRRHHPQWKDPGGGQSLAQ